MKKIFLIILVFFIQSYSQQKLDIINYSQNNTGFQHGFQDFAVDNNGQIIQVGSSYDAMNPGGVTVFDGAHWSFTKKGENNLAFTNAYKVICSENNDTYYVYGSLLRSDIGGQRYFIQKFNRLTDSWELIGDSVSLNYYNGLIDLYETSTGDIYVTGSGGFMKLYPDSSVRIYNEDNPWFYPDYILPKPDGTMYLVDNWTDGWGATHVALWTYNGSSLDTIQTNIDSVNSPVRNVTLDDNGNIWMLEDYNTAANKLVKYSNGTVRTYSIPVNDYAFAFTMVRDGNYLWFGMNNGFNDLLLVKFNILSEDWDSLNLGKVPCFSSNSEIRKIIVKGDYLYLSNPNFIIKYDKTQNSIVATWSVYNSGLPGTAGSNDIVDIDIDKFGHYWINSLNYGVSMFNGDKWKTYSSCEINNSLITTSWALTTDSDGRVFTIGDSLRCLENGMWHSFYPASNQAQIIYGNDIDVDENNHVWFADLYNGLGEFNPENGSFTFYKSGLMSTRANSLFIASDGRIWLGFGDNNCSCASVFDGNDFINYSYDDGVTLQYAEGICETPDGEIWYAFKDGLAKFSDETWTTYTIEGYNIPLNEIKTIAADNNGTIWFGGSSSQGNLKIFSFDGNIVTEHLISEDINNNVSKITIDSNGNIWISVNSTIFVYNPNGDVIIDVEDSEARPSKFTLYQNYPNPFNPTTTIKYSIPSVIARSEATWQSHDFDANVQLTVYNILGEEIATLVNEKQSPGNYSVTFDASNLPSGVYFYTLHVGDFVATKKMVLMK